MLWGILEKYFHVCLTLVSVQPYGDLQIKKIKMNFISVKFHRISSIKRDRHLSLLKAKLGSSAQSAGDLFYFSILRNLCVRSKS